LRTRFLAHAKQRYRQTKLFRLNREVDVSPVLHVDMELCNFSSSSCSSSGTIPASESKIEVGSRRFELLIPAV
jgi:hypothetical protein